MKGKQIIIDDIVCKYYTSGHQTNNTITLFLHGRGDSAKTFQKLIRFYDTNDSPWIAIDFPGFGGTGNPKTDWGVKEYTLRLQHFLQKMNIKKYHIVAHSFGARVTFLGIYENILQPENITLIGAGGIQEKGSIVKLGLIKMIKKILQIFGLQKTLHYLQDKTRSQDYKNAGILAGTFRNIVREDLQYTFPSINIPTLLIRGENDEATPLSHAHIMKAGISNSTLYVISDATHFVHQEFPEQVYQYITKSHLPS